MFSKNKARTARSTGQVDTLIGAQVVIRGDVTFSGGLYIEGRVHGSIRADEGAQAVLTLAEHGMIEGEVNVPVVIVNGQLDGDVHAVERVELAAHARVQGNIHYRVIEMAAGAMFTGRLIHSEVPVRDGAAADAEKA